MSPERVNKWRNSVENIWWWWWWWWLLVFMKAGWRRRYSGSLWTGGSGIRAPVRRYFPRPSRATPRPSKPLVQYNEYPVSSPTAGRPGRGADHPPLLAPGSRLGIAIPMPPLCACLASNGTAVLCKYKLKLCLQYISFYTKETSCQQFCTELAVCLTILYAYHISLSHSIIPH